MKLRFRVNGEISDLEVKRQNQEYHIILGDRTIRARLQHHDGARLLLEVYDPEADRWRQVEAAGAALDKQRRQMWIAGQHVQYERLPIHHDRTGTLPELEGSLSASIPAIVSELLVSEGERVARHQKLILLESMKMIIPIQAPGDGIVSRILCAPGDAVEPGIPLIEMKRDET